MLPYLQAGRTPLHYAAADPNGEHMIKVLQKAGGDAFIDDKVEIQSHSKLSEFILTFAFSTAIHRFTTVPTASD
ncbi:unnamed protein product [Cylicostephanus goldi]|uniref:Uncharacterized protein n=1 Tax=Cylicostephanus goldi TaxID=71465 RepID=A0A3P7N509_CYLGO|nr:unnamed protein product [Cylicostephanus goldi]